MDDMVPAAATNSAVFGRNRLGMCCEEEKFLSPPMAFDEAQTMSGVGECTTVVSVSK
jgi:hypothetical protein